jgi:hypothetical protein
MDGSPAPKISVELEDVADPVLTRVAVTDAGQVIPGSAVDACLRRRTRDVGLSARAVERIGVSSESVTLRDGPSLYGCDNSPGSRESDRRWCGGAFGNLYGGHLRDPRLDVGCTTADGEQMGFAWVEPLPQSKYLALEQPGYVEVYEVADGLPVRVSTIAGVEIEGSHATFRISEHDARGRSLRRYVLSAAVAG